MLCLRLHMLPHIIKGFSYLSSDVFWFTFVIFNLLLSVTHNCLNVESKSSSASDESWYIDYFYITLSTDFNYIVHILQLLSFMYNGYQYASLSVRWIEQIHALQHWFPLCLYTHECECIVNVSYNTVNR